MLVFVRPINKYLFDLDKTQGIQPSVSMKTAILIFVGVGILAIVVATGFQMVIIQL